MFKVEDTCGQINFTECSVISKLVGKLILGIFCRRVEQVQRSRVNISIRGAFCISITKDIGNLAVTESDVEPSPDFGTRLSAECCLGIAKVKENVITLLDIEKVVFAELNGELAQF